MLVSRLDAVLWKKCASKPPEPILDYQVRPSLAPPEQLSGTQLSNKRIHRAQLWRKKNSGTHLKVAARFSILATCWRKLATDSHESRSINKNKSIATTSKQRNSSEYCGEILDPNYLLAQTGNR